jgi:hypothetical protein
MATPSGKTTILINKSLCAQLRDKVKDLNRTAKASGANDRRVTMLDITNHLVEMYVTGKVAVVFPEKRV